MSNYDNFCFPTTEQRTAGGRLYDKQHHGLTKRELLSALILQGLIANPNPGTVFSNVKMSIEYTDELLKQLNQ